MSTNQLANLCLWTICIGCGLVVIRSVLSLWHNVRLARTIGLPYIVLPFSLLGGPWQLAQFFAVPVLKALPERLTQTWLPLTVFSEFWHNGYEPFERLKADTFLVVSPGGLILYTCDPDVNVQLFRDASFGKPAELLSLLNIYGPTITGTDGPESRLYRKVTAPFFSEKTLRRVFVQSVSAAKILLAALLRPDAHRSLRTLSARVSLNTLSQTLSFSQALHGLLQNFGAVFIVPHWLLRLSPFRSLQHAAACYSELGSYMDQLKRAREATISEKTASTASSDEDLLDMLVQAATSSDVQEKPVLLSNAQVIGQIFLFMFAGHEANANLLLSIILLLACHPDVQTAMQRDLDRLLGQTSPDAWSYDDNYAPLMHGAVGAVINETLRLFTVIPVLPKCVPPGGPWLSITVKGQRHPLPPNTIAFVNTSATHRHPKHWPKRPAHPAAQEKCSSSWREIRNDPRQRPYAAADFDPWRWLDAGESAQEATQAGSTTNFLKPRPGTFIPFSDGGRGCLGKRFALVEVCAMVATLFKTHSVELVTDHEQGFNEEEEAWLEARRRATLALSEGTKFDTSLRVARAVPIRFVPRSN
ncbi:cytochrome P450 [Trichoderma citrinoviride]|uniref:Cytochrome P450 n=1 Tax=Trichoderma citrinoviride TaxID=58853 RepID=A0A2T4BCE3_9HYPO|nr:cytochrome P450 [Trichoderma citrinoviride]PTB66985.1 cytochrome P450 [Trichoderma citrinoviride]